jgi:DNA repair ATPase RecN
MSLFLQISFAVVVLGLFVLAFKACMQFTRGLHETNALKAQLVFLQQQFSRAEQVNPRLEREVMDAFHNQIKTSAEAAVISEDSELQTLFQYNCRLIALQRDQSQPEDRTDWIKFHTMMIDFHDRYYS